MSRYWARGKFGEHERGVTSFWKKRNCLCCSSMRRLSFVWEIHFDTRQRFISYISIKSRLRSVKNWRVNSCMKMVFILIKCKILICERKTNLLSDCFIYNRPQPRLWMTVDLRTVPGRHNSKLFSRLLHTQGVHFKSTFMSKMCRTFTT